MMEKLPTSTVAHRISGCHQHYPIESTYGIYLPIHLGDFYGKYTVGKYIPFVPVGSSGAHVTFQGSWPQSLET